MTKLRLGQSMSLKLHRVAERARQDPHTRFHSLAHLLDVEALRRSFSRIDSRVAVGQDGVSKAMYAQELETNLRTLHERLKTGRYRHRPIRRVHIPKGDGKTRPIGVSCIEDKIVQGALCEVLSSVYEQDFLDCSYGFRPKRSAHDALGAVDRMAFGGRSCWVLEADIRTFFDSLDRTKLKEILQQRIADGALLRLIGKCLHVGVLDGEEFLRPDEGTVQGSSISPLLGNVYLHHVLDKWFEDVVAPRLKGPAQLVRYADDFVIGFRRKEDAETVLGLLRCRFEAYGLTLHPDKTRVVAFGRPPRSQTRGKGPGTLDFLGFTLYWRRSRTGRWVSCLKTRTARYRKALKAIHEWCRSHRHLPLAEQHAGLSRRLRGHFNYFGVQSNSRRLHQLREQARRIWFKWLRRRSQRKGRLTWAWYERYLRIYPLPPARITVQFWARAS